MTTPTDHHITITTPDGKERYGAVVHTQACTFTVTEVHIITDDRLACPYRYKCSYISNDVPVHGYFAVFGYRTTDDVRWLFKGLFAPKI